MLLEILSKSLNLMKKNLNLTQLIFIFFIIVTLATPFLSGIKLNLKAIPFIIIFFTFLCAFCAGLFYAFKKSLEYDEKPPENEFGLSPLYFAELFQGTGCYFKKFLFAGSFILALIVLLSFGYDYFIHHYVVIPKSLLNINLNEVMSSDAKMIEFANSLSVSDKAQIGKIGILSLGIYFAFSYLITLYPVVLVKKEDNFLKSFWLSIKSLFKNLPVSLCIFLFFNICIGIATMLNATFATSIIVSIVAILLQCYLSVWYILSLFVYYEKVK